MCVPIMGDGPDTEHEGICVALCTSMNPCTPLECVVTHGGVLNLFPC